MTTETLTLADFLLARIAEDEEWVTEQYAGVTWAPVPGDQRIVPIPGSMDRTLAECEAKRRIVDLTRSAEDSADRHQDMPTISAMEEGRASLGQAMLRALASVYADHPDFRDEWRA